MELRKELDAALLQNGELKAALNLMLCLYDKGGDAIDGTTFANVENARALVSEKRNDEPTQRICWFAEVDRKAQAACPAPECKDKATPKWLNTSDELTDDPNQAKQWSTRAEAQEHCFFGLYRHYHLYPTEHGFIS